MSAKSKLTSCHCCGLVQKMPPIKLGHRAICVRCRTGLKHVRKGRNLFAAVLAASALSFYIPAMMLPMLKISRLGHLKEDSLVSGVVHMLAEGYWFVGIIVLLFSVLLPPLKLFAILMLSNPRLVNRSEHKALLYRAVEQLGKWGMLDVMLVAILVAFVKLGDLVEIHAGSGLIAFAVMVLLSLVSGLLFNPHLMWDDEVKKT